MNAVSSDQPVVAVAILRHGLVLVARRTRPAELAGLWELPGGKCLPDETVAAAAQREIEEELRCTIEVTGALTAQTPLADGRVLVAVTARLVTGEPAPTEHDELQWVAPEDLAEIDWVPADRAFLPELTEIALDGEPLPGGNVDGAVRIGDTVRRPTGPWTPAVHRLLAHLSDVPGVPQVLGIDVRGREVLSYLPGATINPDLTMLNDQQLWSVAARMRTIHDAMARFRPPEPLQWRTGVAELSASHVICHNDPGIYNWAFDEDTATGLFDWDMAGPGEPIDDVAFLAWTAIPLYRDIEPVRCAERLEILASAYGDVAPLQILTAAHRRMRQATERIAAGIARGDPGMQNLAAAGEPARTTARLENLLAHHDQIVDALG